MRDNKSVQNYILKFLIVAICLNGLFINKPAYAMDIAIGSATYKIILPAVMALAACISKSKSDEQAQKLLKEHMVNMVEQSLLNGQSNYAITYAQNINQATIISENQLLTEKDIYDRLWNLGNSSSGMCVSAVPDAIGVSYEFGKSELESKSATNYAYTGSYCLDVMKEALKRPAWENKTHSNLASHTQIYSGGTNRFINTSFDANIHKYQYFKVDMEKRRQVICNGAVTAIIILKNIISYCCDITRQISKEESQDKEIEKLCENNSIFSKAYSNAINKAVDLVFKATCYDSNWLAACLELNKISIPGRAGKIISKAVRYLNDMYFNKNGDAYYKSIDLDKVENILTRFLKSISNNKEEYINYLKRGYKLGSFAIDRSLIEDEQEAKFYQYNQSKLSKFFAKLMPQVSQFWQIDQSVVNDNKYNCSYLNVIEYCDNKEFNRAKEIVDSYALKKELVYGRLMHNYYTNKNGSAKKNKKESDKNSSENINKCGSEDTSRLGIADIPIPDRPCVLFPEREPTPFCPPSEIKLPEYGCGNRMREDNEKLPTCCGTGNRAEFEHFPRPCNYAVQRLSSFRDREVVIIGVVDHPNPPNPENLDNSPATML